MEVSKGCAWRLATSLPGSLGNEVRTADHVAGERLTSFGIGGLAAVAFVDGQARSPHPAFLRPEQPKLLASSMDENQPVFDPTMEGRFVIKQAVIPKIVSHALQRMLRHL